MKMYECIIDNGESVCKETVSAKSKKELLERYGCNGKFIAIKDVTSEYFNTDVDTCIEFLDRTLLIGGYGMPERRLLVALFNEHLQSIKR